MQIKVAIFVLVINCVAKGVENHLRDIEKKIEFSVFSQKYPKGRISSFDEDISDFGCKHDGNISFIVHGWLEGPTSGWVDEMIREFLTFRGNCVYFMDYSFYSNRVYVNLRNRFQQISAVLKKKVLTFKNLDNFVMFGFSFGARLSMNVGIDIYEQKNVLIDKIYACDPAGPGFGFFNRDLTKAARFLQCINTSTDKGTSTYNCHQNWRLGVCGSRQIGAGPFPLGSHGLCTYFFVKSFRHDFIAKNVHNCKSSRMVKDLPSDYVLGMRETREKYFGDIFAPTSRNSPWNVIEETEIYESDNSTIPPEINELDT